MFKHKRRENLEKVGIYVLEAWVFGTVLCGFLGIILKPNLVMKIISMDVMSTGAVVYYVLIAARTGLFIDTPTIKSKIVMGDSCLSGCFDWNDTRYNW